ncbi:hypothetical protein MMC22_008724 [Lobaria immixta]|nr:hypothetical protein [Lobaria immixta]
MNETDLDLFLSTFNPATADYGKFPSDSQSIGISPVEHVRSSQVHMSVQPKDVTSRSSPMSYSPQDFAPYTSLHFRGQSTSAAFQSTSDPTAIVSQGYGTHREDSPMFSDDFIGDVDSAALHMGQPVSFFPFIAKNASTACSLASTSDTASTRHSECSSIRTSDVLSGLFSPGSEYGIRPRGPQNLLNGIKTCMESRRTCMTSALRILQTLHIPPCACLSLSDETSTSSANRQPRKTDSVLSTNREIMRLVAEMLKCSCLSSSQIQLVLTVICCKLITWYRAIISNSLDDHPDTCTETDVQTSAHPDGSLNTATGMIDERVVRQPFAVGEYFLDTSMESKIRAQVVSSELQQLEALVANLSGRMQEKNPSGNNHVIPGRTTKKRSRSTSTTCLSGLSSAAHARLTAFLHKQLRDVKAESTAIATKDI